MSYGTCKKCGCTDTNACVHPEFGPCWWANKDHDICSHCIELPDDPAVEKGNPDFLKEDCCMCPFSSKEKHSDPGLCNRCKNEDWTPEENAYLISLGLQL